LLFDLIYDGNQIIDVIAVCVFIMSMSKQMSKNFSAFCGHLPLSPFAASTLCRLFTYDTYVIPKCMENALSNRKWGYCLGFYFTRASHTHQKSEAVLMTLGPSMIS